MNAVRISILGVGTELTTGQILNLNARWISRELQALGLTTALHLVVPDDKSLILESLQYCADHTDLIFITGGLGPTSDDFTRDVVAQWAQKKPIWDETSWKHIHDRLSPRGIAIRDIQKQQCYFPEGSRIMVNRQGTANAFFLEHIQGPRKIQLFVLPGPPLEIESVWRDSIQEWLQPLAAQVDGTVIKSWDTLGYGESDIAFFAEEVLQGCPFEKGYRVHFPYVEFKLSYPNSQATQALPWIEKVERQLAPMTALRNGKDAAEVLCEKLSSFPKIQLQEDLPGAYVLSRLFPSAKGLFAAQQMEYVSFSSAAPQTLQMRLWESSPGEARASLFWQGQKRTQVFTSPYNSPQMKERERQYFAEKALLFWGSELSPT